MQAIGFKPARYRLVAYVIAGTLTTVAGVLLANQAGFVSPSTMTWQRSGDLIFMVVLGGTGTLHGAILGAVAYLVAEELLAQVTEHWPIIFGPLLVLSVFVARTGLIQFLSKSGARQ
jgi:branched-chain amino acid transport system permease protein